LIDVALQATSVSLFYFIVESHRRKELIIMNKDLIEMVFILDRSGSMDGLQKETIGGFNGLIEKQKRLEGQALVTTVLFVHRLEVLHYRVPIHEIRPLTEKDYYVRGRTALLDAINETVHMIDGRQREDRECDKPAKTVVVITTDGMENASTISSYHHVADLIERQKKLHDWEFIFLGANIDSFNVAKRMGISFDRVSNYHADHRGVAYCYASMDEFVTNLRRNPKRQDHQWKRAVETDFNKRNK
jgi:uncharacterized protein YegL